ncbi:tRNA (adenosine(37)-N6)-threonylcarbamoyltransferase complex ATPase subunit type 1 TsaE [Nocardia otitidiscaviarum]|uniref:tRNA (adenosine(37)-N6)-threonylcarbamoyltransferase complex ATPase subunit type 1 TsaE n=1 Tax=Nocardia otitidiscaviarum TaxID=1823 RepID=UPI0004A75F17|nr:tRNA (adenosine(37)-N6)-threonylcarbamoyltransferase complex ATPase subunit type 1 TsaE [Nocardia otitidiscaviarum]MBF6133729.1 tRNA (adenosine(37)-N6)-threonylcarbamoyltransferase complex ATPase subunit type 1 TsaE [Nocardia otitidiscaviarum]MBF6235689.1 tRNA (adenosine(37)-N6)-threonylcarbamoyltransferase complex ATPase subunit type 1 TsaE [Nocardia otitidiscaviarum]MBF6487757.1 tRNA (adenosine(37)-N6)-threonylcarbamoyltransferase complex ATPase subunit type 1 TsaE [Nocardia otitidiscaviaru
MHEARGHRTLPTVEDTEALGRELAAQLHAGDLVVLDGPLGAGKTALTRGIAAGLGVQGRVSSPTFIIARQHRAGAEPGAVGLVHVDAYRLGGDLDELDALDLDTELDDAVVVVEWGLGVVEHLTERHLRVLLRREAESDTRTAEWEWVG